VGLLNCFVGNVDGINITDETNSLGWRNFRETGWR